MLSICCKKKPAIYLCLFAHSKEYNNQGNGQVVKLFNQLHLHALKIKNNLLLLIISVFFVLIPKEIRLKIDRGSCFT